MKKKLDSNDLDISSKLLHSYYYYYSINSVFFSKFFVQVGRIRNCPTNVISGNNIGRAPYWLLTTRKL